MSCVLMPLMPVKDSRLLHRAVDEIVVGEIGLEAERAGNVVVLAAAIAGLDRLDIVGIERAIGVGAAHEIVDERVLVIDRDPDMPVIARHARIVGDVAEDDVGPHLLERHDVLIEPHEILLAVELAVRDVAVAVGRLVHLDLGRAVAHEVVAAVAEAVVVQVRHVRGVEPALERLEVIARLQGSSTRCGALPARASIRSRAPPAACPADRDRPTPARRARPSDRI